MILNGLTLGLFDPRPDVYAAKKQDGLKDKKSIVEISGVKSGDEHDDAPVRHFLPFTAAFRPFL
jgi:hypothetical protein